MKNEKQIILISACLLGSKVRYDGQAKEYKNIRKLLDYYDIIPICPEVDGGLKIPRPKAEIVGNKVMNEKGKDVTSFFNDGAYKALQVTQFKNVAFVILKEGSPSCGSNFVYDGTFSGKKIPGQGVTAKLLKKSGIHIYSENDIPDLIFKLENNKN